jgi:lactate dehydrogenase-like 2-hydroxyacid dehydrogenase
MGKSTLIMLQIDQMKKGVMLISTGFGRLVNAEDVVQSPKCGRKVISGYI